MQIWRNMTYYFISIIIIIQSFDRRSFLEIFS